MNTSHRRYEMPTRSRRLHILMSNIAVGVGVVLSIPFLLVAAVLLVGPSLLLLYVVEPTKPPKYD